MAKSRKSKTAKPSENSRFFSENKNIIYFICGMIGLMILFALLQPLLVKILQLNPDIYDTYIFVKGQLSKNSLLWLFIIAIIGSLFFITIPTDFMYFYYLLAGANVLTTSLVYFIGIMIGRTIDYWIGYLFSGFVIKNVLKENHAEFDNKFSLWGSSILFFGSLIPFFPIEFFAAFVGTLKFNFWKFFTYSSLGKILKLLLLVLFVKYFLIYNVEFLNFNFLDFVKSLLQVLLPAAP